MEGNGSSTNNTNSINNNVDNARNGNNPSESNNNNSPEFSNVVHVNGMEVQFPGTDSNEGGSESESEGGSGGSPREPQSQSQPQPNANVVSDLEREAEEFMATPGNRDFVKMANIAQAYMAFSKKKGFPPVLIQKCTEIFEDALKTFEKIHCAAIIAATTPTQQELLRDTVGDIFSGTPDRSLTNEQIENILLRFLIIDKASPDVKELAEQMRDPEQ